MALALALEDQLTCTLALALEDQLTCTLALVLALIVTLIALASPNPI